MILGATTNVDRYAWLAAQMLTEYKHEIVPVGIREGEVMGENILDLNVKPPVSDVHTVTLYLNPNNQIPWYDYIISLNPKRIVFNPGTENEALQTMAEQNGIETVIGCTLVMLRSKTY